MEAESESNIIVISRQEPKSGALWEFLKLLDFRYPKETPARRKNYCIYVPKEQLMFLTELLLMILLMLVLPTVDVGTDLRIAIIWFSTRRYWA